MNRNRIAAVLLFNLAALAVFGYLLLNRKSAAIPPVAPVTEATQTTVHKPARQSPSMDYSYIAKNDLFHPLRGKPSDEENKPEARKSGPPGRFKFDLRGVFRSDGKYGALIIVSGGSPAPRGNPRKADGEIFFQGAEIAEGCVLQEINSDSAVILHNGEKTVVKLEKLQPPEKNDEQEKTEKQNNHNTPGSPQ